jgi:hypothetical protein
LDVERDFTIRPGLARDGIKVEFRPYSENWSPSEMSEPAALFGAVVAIASADPDATLRVMFGDKRQPEVLPDLRTERLGIFGWWPPHRPTCRKPPVLRPTNDLGVPHYIGPGRSSSQ